MPAATRAKVDRASTTDLDAARAELATAKASLAELERSAATTGKPTAASQPVFVKPPTTDSAAWAAEVATHDRARVAALAKIDASNAAWRRADLAWRQRWVAEANDRVEMVICERELTRAQTIDHSLFEGEFYDTAPLRGQFSKAQVRWYKSATEASAARGELERTAATLTSAKEAYAQLMRNGPGDAMLTAELTSPDDRAPALILPGWNLSRSDIRLRRGLRHFLDDIASAPQLKQTPVQLSTRRAPPAAKPAEETKPAAKPNRGPSASVAPAPVGTASGVIGANAAVTASAAPPKPSTPAPAARQPVTAAKAAEAP